MGETEAEAEMMRETEKETEMETEKETEMETETREKLARSLDDIFDKKFTEEEVAERFKRQAPTPDSTSVNAGDLTREIQRKESFIGFHRLFKHLAQVNDINKDNCAKQRAENLTMPGDVAHNVDKYFD